MTPPELSDITPTRELPAFGASNEEAAQTDILPTPLRLLDRAQSDASAVSRYTLCGKIEYGHAQDAQLAVFTNRDGVRRTVVVQRLSEATRVSATPGMSPDALLGCHVRHPSVIPVIDLIQGQGELMLVMEHVLGATLAQLRLHGNRAPLPVGVAYVSGMLNALHAAHTGRDAFDAPLHIVHGSIAPHNVLLGVDGVVRLIHFGRAREDANSHRPAPSLAGSPGYFAPEQVFDQRVDARSDVFATGVVLWECLSGRDLIGRGSAVDSMLRFLAQPAPTPSSINPAVPRALDAVVARALEPTPERRYQSAAEFNEALEQALAPASRGELAHYVEGVAWATLCEQRARLLEAAADSADADPTPPRAEAQLERKVNFAFAPADADETTLNRGRFFKVEIPSHAIDETTLNLGRFLHSDAKNDRVLASWQTREPDEPTVVEGLRASPPPLADAFTDMDEAPAVPPSVLRFGGVRFEAPVSVHSISSGAPPNSASKSSVRFAQASFAQASRGESSRATTLRRRPPRFSKLALLTLLVALSLGAGLAAFGPRSLEGRLRGLIPQARSLVVGVAHAPSTPHEANTDSSAPTSAPTRSAARPVSSERVNGEPALRVLRLEELPLQAPPVAGRNSGAKGAKRRVGRSAPVGASSTLKTD